MELTSPPNCPHANVTHVLSGVFRGTAVLWLSQSLHLSVIFNDAANQWTHECRLQSSVALMEQNGKPSTYIGLHTVHMLNMKVCFVQPCNIPHNIILLSYPKVNKGHIIMLHRKLGRFPVSQSPECQKEGVPPRSSEEQHKLQHLNHSIYSEEIFFY